MTTDDVERAKALLADGDIWLVSGANGRTHRWYVFTAEEASKYRPGARGADGSRFVGPFATSNDAKLWAMMNYPDTDVMVSARVE